MQNQGQSEQKGFNQNPYIRQNQNMGGMNQGRRSGGGQNSGMGMNQSDSMSNMQNPYYSTNSQNSSQQNSSLYGSFETADFIKGALIGAVGAYLLTNEKAQKTIFKTAVKGSEMFQAGMEEMKERFEDAKAESEAEKS